MISLRRLGLLPFEQGINQLLRHDPASRARLGALAGKCIKLQLSAPPCSFFLLPQSDGVSLRPDHQPGADVEIHATLPALVAYLGNSDSGPALQLHGDAELAGELQAILGTLDIDWEAALARLTGGLFAHQAGRLLREARRQLDRGSERLDATIENYLVEEYRAMPARAELTQFNDAVDQLRFDSDRLEARLKRLERQHAGRTPA